MFSYLKANILMTTQDESYEQRCLYGAVITAGPNPRCGATYDQLDTTRHIEDRLTVLAARLRREDVRLVSLMTLDPEVGELLAFGRRGASAIWPLGYRSSEGPRPSGDGP